MNTVKRVKIFIGTFGLAGVRSRVALKSAFKIILSDKGKKNSNKICPPWGRAPNIPSPNCRARLERHRGRKGNVYPIVLRIIFSFRGPTPYVFQMHLNHDDPNLETSLSRTVRRLKRDFPLFGSISSPYLESLV
jgi:hypothetical protein